MEKRKRIYGLAQDPIYIGTGGYTIGRVDNTIVRDPITRIPKIPGSSIAGTWRYYMALKLYSYFKDEYKKDRKKRREIDNKDNLSELFENGTPNWIVEFEGNRYAAVKCAGQDEQPNAPYEDAENSGISRNTGHCGHCIVCKTFGFSKKDKSQQGLAFFTDMNILFFPVFTRLGVRWITSPEILKLAGVNKDKIENPEDGRVIVETHDKKEGHMNLGWLNLEIDKTKKFPEIPMENELQEILSSRRVLVPDDLISQIINANLEVRTSVSIDPLTGAAKQGALFTSEAIPRGTVFHGEIRLMERPVDVDIPDHRLIWNALDSCKTYFENFGIGGMVTRGFGRIKILPSLNGSDNKTGGGGTDGSTSKS
ncbi:hypothetical protein H0A61_00297 [Koleobacter methoxysyntrophicus]|uniref:CRISPR type III-associated protein domain-containing protein n=1 Tax=Koleobacter methoxysyntrophicus TaxID=2751313 RepID=A0A8A0RK17_9FIRM|nr:RAMP superfamily CRISPR-associated protein [Koleobacter methoxysyntrophicus]QSQ07978.1 hypothetical protein H0A61_00297 [Koleobacter methoxysyntrophicus]